MEVPLHTSSTPPLPCVTCRWSDCLIIDTALAWCGLIHSYRIMWRLQNFDDACEAVETYPNATVAEYGVVTGETDIMAEVFARGPVACEIDATPLHTYTVSFCLPNGGRGGIQSTFFFLLVVVRIGTPSYSLESPLLPAHLYASSSHWMPLSWRSSRWMCSARDGLVCVCVCVTLRQQDI